MLFSKKNALPASFYYMALKSKTASQRKKNKNSDNIYFNKNIQLLFSIIRKQKSIFLKKA
jgi:hypothetical protein